MSDKDLEMLTVEIISDRILSPCIRIINTVDQLTVESIYTTLNSSPSKEDLFKTLRICKLCIEEILEVGRGPQSSG
jgi:hypothetical protein